MGRVEKLIEIRAPPEKIWEMLAFDRFQEWVHLGTCIQKKWEWENWILRY